MATYARLTMFALLSSLEEDLRTVLMTVFDYATCQGIDDSTLFPIQIKEKTEGRFFKKNPLEAPTNSDLIEFLDFQDSIDLIKRNLPILPPNQQAIYIPKLFTQLSRLSPIRNRVVHSRPLEYSDFPTLCDTIEDILIIDKKHESFSLLWDISRKIKKDPGITLSYSIPDYIDIASVTPHNLPLADFDDTGFIGRSDLIQQIVPLLLKSPYPVISILGDGGMGKTSLALKIAYQIVDDGTKPFDTVIWISSKTTQLNTSEIEKISGAIQNSLELFSEVSKQLYDNANDPIQNILEYMENFKILLIIDNLETILDDSVMSFLKRLPRESKVLITSRIGLGSIEYPVKIPPFSNTDSVKLIRNAARVKQIQILQHEPQQKLEDYCTRMNNNPGYIKWFVAAIGTGKSPESILANPSLFLDFCMSNVYNYLSSQSKQVINILHCSRRELTLAEIAFVSNMEIFNLQSAIQQLITTNMVFMGRSDYRETFYGITEFARLYLAKAHPVENTEMRKIKSKFNQLASCKDSDTCDNYRYNIGYIFLRSDHDLAIAIQLKSALKAASIRDLKLASEIIDRAFALSADYFEVHRIRAYIKSLQALSTEAEDEYRAAIELSPNQPHLHYSLGLFTLNSLGNSKEALKHFRKAVELDPNSFDPSYEVARVLMFSRQYDDVNPIFEKFRTYYLTPKQKLLVRYLHMQIEYRKADDAYHIERNFKMGYEHLSNLFTQYESMSQIDRTSDFRKLMDKCEGTLIGLRKIASSIEEQTLIKKLLEGWLSLVGRDRYYQNAIVTQISKYESTGNLLLNNGESLFFKKEWCIDDITFDNIDINKKVLAIKFLHGDKIPSARYIKLE